MVIKMFTDLQIKEDEMNAKLQRKFIWVLVITGCFSNLVGFLSNAVMFGMSLPTVVCGVCVIFVVVCGVIAIGFGKQKSASAVIVMMFVLVEFPFLLYVYGANMGVYLVLGIVALAVYFPRPYHIPAIIITILLHVSVMILSYFHPSTMEEMDRKSQMGTMICSYIIVAVASAVILCNLISQYV